MAEEEKIDKNELLKRLQEEMDKLTVPELMGQMAANLATVGFRHLGLPSEENAQYKDLNQSRLAIDGLDAFIKLLEKEISEEEVQVLKTALSNLQLLYVKESQADSQQASSQQSEVNSQQGDETEEKKAQETEG